MAPEQVRFLPVTDRAGDYCAEQARKLEDLGFRVEVDYRNEKIGKKIREAQMEKVPYMVVVGDRDMENNTVFTRPSCRRRSGRYEYGGIHRFAEGCGGLQGRKNKRCPVS